MNPIAELQRLLCNMILIGVVVEIDHDLALARLEIGESETDWLQWPEQNAAEIISSNPPKLGESWLVLSPSGEIEQAIMALRLTSEDHPHLINDGSEKKTRYPDGTEIGYNHQSHALTVSVPESGTINISVNGPVTINAADKATISAPEIDLGQSGLEPMVLGDKLAIWITAELSQWLNTHHHGNNVPPVAPFVAGTATAGGAVYSTKNRSQ